MFESFFEFENLNEEIQSCALLAASFEKKAGYEECVDKGSLNFPFLLVGITTYFHSSMVHGYSYDRLRRTIEPNWVDPSKQMFFKAVGDNG